MNLIVSAYTCCGKTYAAENAQHHTIKDLDYLPFAWLQRKRNDKELEELKRNWESEPHLMAWQGKLNHIKDDIITVRNPNFVQDYLSAIKQSAEENDVTLISSHLEIRQALTDENIPFYTVYPENTMSVRNEWLGRMLTSKKQFHLMTENGHWNHFVPKIDSEPHGTLVKLSNNEYLTEQMLSCFIDEQKIIKLVYKENK